MLIDIICWSGGKSQDQISLENIVLNKFFSVGLWTCWQILQILKGRKPRTTKHFIFFWFTFQHCTYNRKSKGSRLGKEDEHMIEGMERSACTEILILLLTNRMMLGKWSTLSFIILCKIKISNLHDFHKIWFYEIKFDFHQIS